MEFNTTKDNLNKILLLLGCIILDNGKIEKTNKAPSLKNALYRTNKLKSELEIRNVHNLIFKYCSEEYLANDYFHACFEAVKGTLKRLKEMVHSLEDGNKLIDIVFSSNKPLIVINKMETQSEKNEFEGLKNLFLFLLKGVRNYDAHETRLGNEIELDKALDIFACISLANKYLDMAQVTCFVC